MMIVFATLRFVSSNPVGFSRFHVTLVFFEAKGVQSLSLGGERNMKPPGWKDGEHDLKRGTNFQVIPVTNI